MTRFYNILFWITTLTHTIVVGQDKGYLDGYIVTNNKDTISGVVKFINPFPYAILRNIKFKKSENAEVEIYSPDKLLGFKVGETVCRSFEYMDMNSSTLYSRDFMILIINGSVSLYRLKITTNPGQEWSKDFLLKRGEDRLQETQNIKFKVKIPEYLSDNIELSEKIKKGVYKRKDIEKIIAEYNNWKAQNSY